METVGTASPCAHFKLQQRYSSWGVSKVSVVWPVSEVPRRHGLYRPSLCVCCNLCIHPFWETSVWIPLLSHLSLTYTHHHDTSSQVGQFEFEESIVFSWLHACLWYWLALLFSFFVSSSLLKWSRLALTVLTVFGILQQLFLFWKKLHSTEQFQVVCSLAYNIFRAGTDTPGASDAPTKTFPSCLFSFIDLV